MAETKLGTRDAIAAHGQKLVNELIDAGKVVPDAAAAVAASAVPTFSEGTLPLDPNTGKPIVAGAPAAADPGQIGGAVTVDPAATGALGNDAEAGAAAEAAAAGRQRDAKGQFTPAAPAEPAPLAADAPVAATPTTGQRQAAVDEAASAILDEWAEFEEIPFQHDDGSTYTVRAKKAEAKQVARFNQRQAQVDRAKTWLGRYKDTLEPLIVQGQLDPILPVLQRAIADPELRDAITQMYNRRLTGQPLYPQQAAPPQQAPQPVTQPAAVTLPQIEDPFIAEAVGPVLAPIMSQLQAIQQAQQQATEQQRAQQAAAQRQQAEQAQRLQTIQAAHQDMARFYPASFTGDPNRDSAIFNNVVRYAKDGGYVDAYGTHRGLLLAAQAYINERAADTGSPAAAMIAQVDQATMRAAQAQAAGARAVGGGATTAARAPAKPAPPQAPTTKGPDGKTKPIAQMKAELLAYNQAMAAAGQ